LKNQTKQVFNRAYKDVLAKRPTSISGRKIGSAGEMRISGVHTPFERQVSVICENDLKRRAALVSSIMKTKGVEFAKSGVVVISDLKNIMKYYTPFDPRTVRVVPKSIASLKVAHVAIGFLPWSERFMRTLNLMFRVIRILAACLSNIFQRRAIFTVAVV
jgi:hypothetical protein